LSMWQWEKVQEMLWSQQSLIEFCANHTIHRTRVRGPVIVTLCPATITESGAGQV
jgi:hypothetical protein